MQKVSGGHAARILCDTQAVTLDQPPFLSASVAEIPEIPGARILRDICSAAECAQFILFSEVVGFSEDSSGLWTSVFDVDGTMHDVLFERLRQLLPSDCFGGALSGLSPSWTVERREVGGPAGVPGPWGAYNKVEQARDTIIHRSRDNGSLHGAVVRATFLLFLNRGFQGGEHCFWIPDQNLAGFQQLAVLPEQGAGLFFFCRDHPLSLICETKPLDCGHRHVLQFDVLYERASQAAEAADLENCVAAHPHIFHGRQKWEQGAGQMAALRQALGCSARLLLPPPRPDARGSPGVVPPTCAPPPCGPLDDGLPLSATKQDPVESCSHDYVVGELVEAFWAPEHDFFRARVIAILGQGRTLSVRWTEWPFTVDVPISEVRKCQEAGPNPPQTPAEWAVID